MQWNAPAYFIFKEAQTQPGLERLGPAAGWLIKEIECDRVSRDRDLCTLFGKCPFSCLLTLYGDLLKGKDFIMFLFVILST